MFKDKIKALRKAQGLTQKQLAQIIGVDVSAVGKWEGKGNILPSDGVREQIADYFGVSLDYLMDRTSAADVEDSTSQELLTIYAQLSSDGKQLVLDYANMIFVNPKYRKKAAIKAG